MKQTFHVTEDHIRRGIPKEACSCPISLCLTEAGFDDNAVSCGYIYLDAARPHVQMPIEAEKFVEEFDNGNGGLGAFSFELDIPDRI